MNYEQTVFIVDADAGARQSLAALVRAMDLDSESFASATEYLNVFDPMRPGCLLLNACLPGMSGLELLERINRPVVYMPAIVIAAHADLPSVIRAVRAGAIDFLEKPYPDQTLRDAIQEALNWDSANRRRLVKLTRVRRRLDDLAAGECVVLQKLMEGKCNRVIAGDLNVSVRTVEVRRGKLMRKMKAGSLAELVRMTILAETGGWKTGEHQQRAAEERLKPDSLLIKAGT